MAFPTDLDSFARPSATDPLNSPSHTDVHNLLADAIEALEAKLGTGASTPDDGLALQGAGVGGSSWAELAAAPAGGASVDFQAFTAPDVATWLAPAGTILVALVICIGAGGGGGGGSKGAAGQLNTGGGGGGGGGRTDKWIKGADLVGNQHLYVGFGGAAGSGATSDNTRGTDANAGDRTAFGQSVVSDASTALVVAGAGDGGVRGNLNLVTNNIVGASPGFGNVAGRLWLNRDTGIWTTGQAHELSASGGRSADTTTENSPNGADKFACGGGGAGGITTTGNVARNGGRGGIPAERRGGDRFNLTDSTSGWPFSAGGTAPGGSGGTVPAPTDVVMSGFGGGGGAARVSGAATAGAGVAGGLYGGGGGGGGAGRNSVVNGGDGADGGHGAVFVFCWYTP